MKSIAKAINNVAIAITNLGKVLVLNKPAETKDPVSTTITSNPISTGVKIKTQYYTESYTQPKSKSWESSKFVRIPQEEKDAIDAIYKALTEKGSHPDHHDHIMRELLTKWPVLHSALNRLIRSRKETYNQYTNYSDIWKTKDKW